TLRLVQICACFPVTPFQIWHESAALHLTDLIDPPRGQCPRLFFCPVKNRRPPSVLTLPLLLSSLPRLPTRQFQHILPTDSRETAPGQRLLEALRGNGRRLLSVIVPQKEAFQIFPLGFFKVLQCHCPREPAVREIFLPESAQKLPQNRPLPK